jgi:hypothetical protein
LLATQALRRRRRILSRSRDGKCAAFIVSTLLLSAAGLAAQQEYPSLAPKDAVSMALGGVFTAIPTAEFSFFGNPAAFAASAATLTLLSADTWAYLKPTGPNIASLAADMTSRNPLSALAGFMPGNGGVGGGASVGIGYAGKGLGLGLFATSDNYAAGVSVPGAVLTSDTEIDVVLGLGMPMKLLGSTLSIGGDLRPFYRALAVDSLADASNSLTSSSGAGGIQTTVSGSPDAVDAGFGLAMDLGAALQLGSVGIGVSIRDISPTFPVWTGSFKQFADSLETGALPTASGSANTAVLVPNVGAGMSWTPHFIPGVVDPAVYLEIQDVVRVVQNWDGIGSALDLLHAGIEVKVLNFITLRGGIDRGWLSAGAGVRLLFLDLNAAVFTEELGALPGDSPRSGLALQAAIRF